MTRWRRPEGAPLVVVDSRGGAAFAELSELVPEPAVVCRGSDPWQLAADVRDAVSDGIRFIVCVGGDAAYLAAAAGSRDVYGVLLGHGGGPASLPRSFGLPPDATRCAPRLIEGTVADLDAVRVTPRRGEPVEFVSMAGWGSFRVAGFGGGKFGRWGFGLRLGGLWPWRDRVEIRMGDVCRKYRASGLVVANGEFLAGLDVVPRAHPGDGKLEILVFEGPARDLWRILPRVASGSHLPHARVRELRPQRAEIDGTGRVFADAVDIAKLPATFEAVTGRLRIAL